MIKFGTDGVRGVANKDLTPEDAFALGLATGYVLGNKSDGHKPNILIGKDTRISSNMLESALIAGICSVGAIAHVAGVIPTPAIATLVKKYGYDAGVMISASHNPVPDNGIKIFNNQGYKLDDEIEDKIIKAIYSDREIPRPTGEHVGTYFNKENIEKDYIDFLKTTIDGTSLKGIKVALDCANGATYSAAPKVFTDLGATVHCIHNEPNGININENCGSTHMESLVEYVKSNKLDIGIAFDGDGDRCLVVDNKGNILCGDQLMSIISNYLKEQGKLEQNTLVSTVMSNIGLDQMGKKHDINIVRTAVGDRYVLEQMLDKKYNFGGEQSGHFIFLDYTTTGDGILTGLQVLKIMADKKKSLEDINKYITMHPQVTLNAYVNRDKKDSYSENSAIKSAVQEATKRYDDTGRVLVRASGTESMVRVTIEGENIEDITKTANSLKELIEKELS